MSLSRFESVGRRFRVHFKETVRINEVHTSQAAVPGKFEDVCFKQKARVDGELLTKPGFGSWIGLSMVAAAILTVSLPVKAQVAGVVLGPTQPELPGVNQGELLLGELNCVSCHSAPSELEASLANRSTPVLGPNGLSLTPQFIRAYLINPSRENPGTTMPDMLSGLSDKKRAETVEALVHYLVSLAPIFPATNVTGDSVKVAQGRELFHTVGCVACHAPEETKGSTDAEGVLRLQQQSAPLSNLANKLTVDDLAKFLLDPVRYRPSGRMPSLNLSKQEAEAIAVYLLKDQLAEMEKGSKTHQKLPGIVFQYFEAVRIQSVADLDKLAPVAEGFTNRIVLPPHRNEQFGLRYRGLVNAQESGSYSFHLTSDDGSKLYIDGKLVVDNDGVHPLRQANESVRLEAGDHNFTLLYFNAGGDHELKLTWQPPGAEKPADIPAKAFSHAEVRMEPLGKENFTVDSAKAAKGKESFSVLGCAACHELGQTSSGTAARAKPLLKLNPTKGCLANKPPRKVARYDLSLNQLAALRKTLENKAMLTKSPDAKTRAAYTLTRLNCTACHSRDGVGGPSAARSPYFVSIGEVDLGDEGRIPPHLNGVGSKLRTEWLRDVLLNKAAARPYMATRMPQFGSNNVSELVTVLAQADGPVKAQVQISESDAKFGRKLVGTGGMSCITCHMFAGHKSLGVPAMDLTLMSKRLQKDWFTRYLPNPASLRPGTRMPSFWPAGKSVRSDILGGDTTRQINAIWAYLSSSKDLGLPDGLVQGKIELVADKEAVIYRNFITGSPRSIGVGYPEKANLNWDANEMRLVTIWQGAFIDAAKHRTGRGEGFVDPLGYNVVQFPQGAPLAILQSPDQKWPTASGKAAGYQMKGYVLDDIRRPTFHYNFAGIQVEDFFQANGTDTDAYLVRTLSFKGSKPAGNLWLRAWAGTSVEPMPDNCYLLDGKVKVKFSSASGAPLVRQSEGNIELLVPVNLDAGQAKIEEQIIW